MITDPSRLLPEYSICDRATLPMVETWTIIGNRVRHHVRIGTGYEYEEWFPYECCPIQFVVRGLDMEKSQ